MELTWRNKHKVVFYDLDGLNNTLNPVWIEEDAFQEMKPFSFEIQRTIGEISSGNKLILGDNLLSLKALTVEFEGKVKCIYIDPPYNTGYTFNTYDDNFEHTEWLGMMYHRLKLLNELLNEDGVLFVQLRKK
jgi:adenine-specific DNA-methyltransferase